MGYFKALLSVCCHSTAEFEMSPLTLVVVLVLGASLAQTSCPPKEGERKCVPAR